MGDRVHDPLSFYRRPIGRTGSTIMLPYFGSDKEMRKHVHIKPKPYLPPVNRRGAREAPTAPILIREHDAGTTRVHRQMLYQRYRHVQPSSLAESAQGSVQ